MSADKTVEAFNIGANSSSIEVSTLIISLVFAILLMMFAYIVLNAFEALKNRKITFPAFFKIIIRVAFFITILGYFLLS